MLVWLGRSTVPLDWVSTCCYLAFKYKLGRSCTNSNLLRPRVKITVSCFKSRYGTWTLWPILPGYICCKKRASRLYTRKFRLDSTCCTGTDKAAYKGVCVMNRRLQCCQCKWHSMQRREIPVPFDWSLRAENYVCFLLNSVYIAVYAR